MLKTVLLEPKYIKDALKKESKLPEYYWRLELCIIFFLEEKRSDLPRALQNNFCPLFWFSNFLLLVAPIWGTIYAIGYTLRQIYSLLCTYVTSPVWDRWESYTRAYSRKQMLLRDKRETEVFKVKHTFNPSEPRVTQLRWGESFVSEYTHNLKAAGAITEVDWDSDEFLSKLNDEDVYYFATFRRLYKDKWKDTIAKIIEEDKKRSIEKLEAAQAAEKKIKESKARRERFFSKLFGYAKTLCQVMALLVAIPGVIAVAYFVYLLTIKLWYVIGVVYHFLFVEHLPEFLEITGCVILGLVLVMVASITVKALRGLFWTPVVNAVAYCCDISADLLRPVAKVIVNPIVWIGRKIGGFFSFVLDFVRMFFTDNCPHIEWEEEEKERK